MQFCYLENLKKLALYLSEKWPNLSQATVTKRDLNYMARETAHA